MDFRDALSTLLPAPRDDEPAGLRQDILDELADHLTSAYNRELLRGADRATARQRVLDKFGDPAAIARRLWFDAMKGKIMMQRILIATCVVLAMASVSLVALVYIQSNRVAAQSTEANRQIAQALAQAQATNQDMLSKLAEMSEAIRNPRSPDWNPVKFVVTDDTPDGPPVAGCMVTLSQGSATGAIARETDASGVADFGLVHPGQYSYQVSRREKAGLLSGFGPIDILPGSQVSQRIVCPRKALEPVPVLIRCDWPPELANEGLIVCAPFGLMPMNKSNVSWSLQFGTSSPTRSILCGPGTAIKEISNPWGLYVWAASTSPQLRADVPTSELREITDRNPLNWEQGDYRIDELTVLRPIISPVAAESGRVRFAVVLRCYSSYTNPNSYEFRQKPPSDSELSGRRGDIGRPGATQVGVSGLGLQPESWSKLTGPFEARPNRVNDWKIKLPDELIQAVREKLKSPDRPEFLTPVEPSRPPAE